MVFQEIYALAARIQPTEATSVRGLRTPSTLGSGSTPTLHESHLFAVPSMNPNSATAGTSSVAAARSATTTTADDTCQYDGNSQHCHLLAFALCLLLTLVLGLLSFNLVTAPHANNSRQSRLKEYLNRITFGKELTSTQSCFKGAEQSPSSSPKPICEELLGGFEPVSPIIVYQANIVHERPNATPSPRSSTDDCPVFDSSSSSFGAPSHRDISSEDRRPRACTEPEDASHQISLNFGSLNNSATTSENGGSDKENETPPTTAPPLATWLHPRAPTPSLPTPESESQTAAERWMEAGPPPSGRSSSESQRGVNPQDLAAQLLPYARPEPSSPPRLVPTGNPLRRGAPRAGRNPPERFANSAYSVWPEKRARK